MGEMLQFPKPCLLCVKLCLTLISPYVNQQDYDRDQKLISIVPFRRVETLKYHKLSANMQRIGVIGGTFDPVHYGHLVIAEEVYATLQLKEMVFVPAGQPPHKTNVETTAAEHRLAMLELATASNPHLTISRI